MSWTLDQLVRRAVADAEREGLQCRGDVYVAIRAALRAIGATIDGDLRVTLPALERVVHVGDQERVVRSALRVGTAVYSVPRPGRHCDVMQAMIDADLPPEAMELANQGFLTSEGRWVGRAEAAEIARAACQMVRDRGADYLLSEDVW